MGQQIFAGISVCEVGVGLFYLAVLVLFFLICVVICVTTSRCTVKFLIDREGNPYKRYNTTVTPLELKQDIEMLLQKK
jgi:membrane-anchored glycerophosphoryl diester phosphodiesterase (GDPDase)